MADSEMRSSVRAELSIDTDTIEQVHERLIRKGNQNQRRQEVIVDAISYVQSSSMNFAHANALLDILNRDCDN